jgi:hypothetical protein
MAWRERMRARTHCSAGHEFTPENTRLKHHNDGRATPFTRVCRICQREGRILV